MLITFDVFFLHFSFFPRILLEATCLTTASTSCLRPTATVGREHPHVKSSATCVVIEEESTLSKHGIKEVVVRTDLDKAEADIIVGKLLWTRRPHMRVASCSSCSICLSTRWIYLSTSCPHRWPGSAGRCATRPKPPQCRRCGAAAPPRRLLDSATSHAASLEKIARGKGRGKSSLQCAKEEDARQGGYADGESADLCARWPIFFRVLKD